MAFAHSLFRVETCQLQEYFMGAIEREPNLMLHGFPPAEQFCDLNYKEDMMQPELASTRDALDLDSLLDLAKGKPSYWI